MTVLGHQRNWIRQQVLIALRNGWTLRFLSEAKAVPQLRRTVTSAGQESLIP